MAGKNPFKEGKGKKPATKGKKCPHCGEKLDSKGNCAKCGKKY